VCCVLVTVAIRVLRDVFFKEDTTNRCLCPKETEPCIYISFNLCEWDIVNMAKYVEVAHESGRLREGKNLIVVQESSCGSSKEMVLK
jgi:hypothetical protein